MLNLCGQYLILFDPVPGHSSEFLLSRRHLAACWNIPTEKGPKIVHTERYRNKVEKYVPRMGTDVILFFDILMSIFSPLCAGNKAIQDR